MLVKNVVLLVFSEWHTLKDSTDRLSEPLEGKGELIKVVYYFLVAMVAGAGQQGSR